MPIRTSLTTLLPLLRVPVICPPMAGAAGGLLAGATSSGGGLGFIGGGYLSHSQLDKEISLAREVLSSNGTFQSESTQSKGLNIGIGFLAWRLTLLNNGQVPLTPASLSSTSEASKLLDLTLRQRPSAIWLAFGEREELKAWCDAVRRREVEMHPELEGDEKGRSKLFVGVGNEEQARWAVEDCGADVVVVTGLEAGGHGLGTAPPLSTLLQTVLTSLPTWSPLFPSRPPPPILGAGGLSDGSSLISLLSLGASAGVFGTRLLLTPESLYTAGQKDLLLSAKDTKRSMAFDEARGTDRSWPKDVDGRGIVNETVRDFEKGEGDRESRRKRYDVAVVEKDASRMIVWAGSGVGKMNRVAGAADVVREIEAEAELTIRRLSESLVR